MIKITQVGTRARRCTMMTRQKMYNCDFISRRRRGSPQLPSRCWRSGGKRERGRGWKRARAKRTRRKNKNLLGLVSNLQQLSSHQRKTAYGEGTVRGCLLKRITALKGSEAKQQYEFRCSCRVMRRVDLGGNYTMEGAQAVENALCAYLSTRPSIHPSIFQSIAF